MRCYVFVQIQQVRHLRDYVSNIFGEFAITYSQVVPGMVIAYSQVAPGLCLLDEINAMRCCESSYEHY